MNVLDPKSLIATFGLIGVLVVIFAETGLLVGFLLPGDTLLVTEGSRRNRAGAWRRDLMEKNADGSLWKLDLSSGKATRILGQLAWAAGVAPTRRMLGVSRPCRRSRRMWAIQARCEAASSAVALRHQSTSWVTLAALAAGSLKEARVSRIRLEPPIAPITR